MKFEELNLNPFILKAIDDLGFVEPTEIQKQIIPIIQANKNVVGKSQTGSGKSHSFLLPLLNQVDPSNQETQIVITTPSRELAEQLYQVATQLVTYSPDEIRISNFVGGTDKQRQINKLSQQQSHVVIGTPGRILDLVNEQVLKIHKTKAFVVDEADMTLDMGFLHDVDQIAGRMPKHLQMLVFSATIPQKLQPFLKKYMENPEIINLEPKQIVAASISNYLLATKSGNKMDVLDRALSIGQPYFTLIFANTKQKVDEIAHELRGRNYEVAVLHGDIPARERKRIMRRVHNMDFQYMVATDLAARGIDIEGVSHVINYEIPKDTEFFVHRIGRTGRKNLPGTAITLYGPDELESVEALEKVGIKFQPVVMKDGGFVETDDRRNREKRNSKNAAEVDPRIKGMVNKAKKKVKPGYKRRLNEQIKRQVRKNKGSDGNRKKR